jgi:ElaB/YqjD/DUF883 family membrane-anchored ribosome-binding protein
MDNDNTVSTAKLIQDIKVVVADADELLRATANHAGEKVGAAREHIEASLKRVKVDLADAQESLMLKAKQGARVADEYVHDNPWSAVGVAGAVGLLIGLLVGRR